MRASLVQLYGFNANKFKHALGRRIERVYQIVPRWQTFVRLFVPSFLHSFIHSLTHSLTHQRDPAWLLHWDGWTSARR